MHWCKCEVGNVRSRRLKDHRKWRNGKPLDCIDDAEHGTQLTFASEGGWRLEHVPHRFGAQLTGGGHVEGDRDKLVSLVFDGGWL